MISYTGGSVPAGILIITGQPSKGWDGRFNGQPVQEGVYAYQIAAVFRNGAAQRFQGNVTLFR